METNVRRRHGWLVVVYAHTETVCMDVAGQVREGFGGNRLVVVRGVSVGSPWDGARNPWRKRKVGDKGHTVSQIARVRSALHTSQNAHKAGARVGARVDTGCGKPPFCS